MREFNINEIEFEKDKVPTEKLLTGEYLKSLEPYSKMQPNAETEDGEYIKYPDKTVVKTISADHENGGVKVAIPDGTLVISNELKPTRKQIKEIERNYKITVSPNDTYAKIVEKFTNKIGLRKLNEEQEQLFKALKKEEEKQAPAATAKVNLEYLTGKIKNIENKKQPLQEERQSFFNYVYNLQEATKPADEAKPVMEYGGEFSQTAAKYGLTPEQAISMLRKGGYFHPSLPSYNEGGKKYSKEQLPQNAEINDTGKGYRVGQYVPQPDGAYLKVTKVNVKPTATADTRTGKGPIEDWIKQSPENQTLAQQANAIIEKGIADKTIVKRQDGSVEIKGSFKPDFKDRLILSQVINQSGKRFGTDKYKIVLQSGTEGYSQRGKGTGSFVAGFTPEDYEKRFALEKMKGEGLSQEEALNEIDAIYKDPQRKLDLRKEYLGFLGVKVPEKSDELLSDNFYKKNYSEVTKGIENKLEATGYRPAMGNDAMSGFEHFDAFGFTANPVYEQEDLKLDVKDKTTPGPEPAKQTTITDKVGAFVPPNQRPPRWFFTPDQTPLPPTPLEAVAMGDVRLGRIDPVRVGIEEQIANAEGQKAFVAQQLEAMPETQKASALALILANSERNLSQAQTQANQINAQNLASAEMFNIGQSDKEAVYGLNNLLNYEQRTLVGKAKAEEQLRNFYTSLKKNNAIQFRDTQKLNLLESMFPEYNLDFSGMRVNFDPDNPNAPVLRDSFLGNYSKILSSPQDQ